MTPLSAEFVEQCPVEDGFRMRGLEMTRIEVFVDAAFAFAVTMLVISFDAIPGTWSEVMVAIKSIPAFVVAVAQLVWIWYTHNHWSRRYGLDTGITVILSTALLIVVLIYIYPMRIMAEGFFAWITNQYLNDGFRLTSWDELADLFIFLSIGFMALCLVYALMYRYAASLKSELRLNESELYETRTLEFLWFGATVSGLFCIVLALILPGPQTPFAGFAYVLLSFWFPLFRRMRGKRRPVHSPG